MGQNTVGQSKKASFVEACVNTVVGFLVTLLVQLAVFPAYGIHVSFMVDLQIIAIFTVVSVARSYFLRRLFERFR